MVNKSTKERGKKGKQASMTEEKPPAEEISQPGGSEETEENKASEETALQPEVIEEEKAHGVEESEEEASKEEEKPAKKARGRPKKTDSGEPAVKKAKTAKKERPAPERTSSRVANQKSGVKLQKTEELPERKRSPTKKASKTAVDNGVTASEQNGAAVEVTVRAVTSKSKKRKGRNGNKTFISPVKTSPEDKRWKQSLSPDANADTDNEEMAAEFANEVTEKLDLILARLGSLDLKMEKVNQTVKTLQAKVSSLEIENRRREVYAFRKQC
ncbi:hypothetical protein ACROYT_G004710 [Oculina patagonica]